ncbi:hypothetical protein CBM2589_B10247 [Cupriavidus taiwanensis]|uniref:Uncharacterized protein n=1 Tax=Cupriavidus taiwanensis TaxID=164546 RepID=A0A375B8H0_9BURK|nr:hypothetical protein CBM2589_B10247 [Cupriavidus taiwanensis]
MRGRALYADFCAAPCAIRYLSAKLWHHKPQGTGTGAHRCSVLKFTPLDETGVPCGWAARLRESLRTRSG